ncbi:Enoyl-CoA hydratase/isomerase [compost metagenome]
MGVTLELLRIGRDLPLDACFALEFHLASQWFANGDFLEGVRALIIDKDKSPRWNPQTLAELSPLRIAEFFRDDESVNQKSRRLA